MNNIQVPFQKRNPITWVPTVYFAMGLPFVILAQTSTLMFKNMGISDTDITFWTSLIMLPWTLKFLWSPFLEMFRSKKYFVVLTQSISGISFALVAVSLPMEGFFKYVIAIFVLVAFSGATHDVATDGIYLNALNPKQQAQYVGWQGAFYNAAKFLSAGAFVALAGLLEKSIGIIHAWMVVFGIFAAIMILLSLLHTRTLPLGGESAQVQTFEQVKKTMKEVLQSFIKKKHILYYLFFIILYRFAEGFAIKVVQLFLRADRAEGGLGLATDTIGLIIGVGGAGAFIVGSVLGGYVIARYGLRKSLFALCLSFNIPFVAYALLAVFQPENVAVVSSAVIFEYFGYGFGFVGLTYFMMQQIAPGKYNMAHYAIASGIMNLGFMLPGLASGWLSDMIGYKSFFIFVLFATIPSLLITWFVPFTYHDDKKGSKAT